MLRLIAKWYAKLSYLWVLEVEAGKGEINGAVATANAAEKRKLVEQLTAEAEAIEANIKTVEDEEAARKSAPEYQKLSTKEQYDDQQASKKEKDAAVQMVTEKRGLAKQESENVTAGEQAAQMLRGRADNSRAFADKIRRL